MTVEFKGLKDANQILFIGITGTKDAIRARLEHILADFDTYGKPKQGMLSDWGSESHVITPKWEGKKH